LEFDYANQESFYCRPLRSPEHESGERTTIPDEASEVSVAFLPPMSGLASSETRLDPGAVNVRLGEGRTAEVLRNLCYQIRFRPDGETQWAGICTTMKDLFGVSLEEPRYVAERGEITMAYHDHAGIRLDLSSAGRGLQQTLLVLAHLMVNPKSVVLIDEPDAHLEILRQRQIYELLCQTARHEGSQIIAASHSEVVLNEAADRDVVVAFVGKPHRVDDRGCQLLKSLKEIGFEQFIQAEQTGWVLYLEGSTDLAILRSFARVLEHPVAASLQRPFVHYVMNQPARARSHFFGLQEAKRDLTGIGVFDRLPQTLQVHPSLAEVMWSRREIENYLCTREALLAWAKRAGAEDGGRELFAAKWVETMEQTITEVEEAMKTLSKGEPWSPDTKVTDDFLDPLFRKFFQKLGMPSLLDKTDYHVLADYLPRDQIDDEVRRVLDRIAEVARRAVPAD
jgi:hypothetical protein